MRVLSAATKQAVFAAETSEVFLVLLTISGSGMTTLRVVNNTVDVTSRGNPFVGLPFEIIVPDDLEDRVPSARITLDNVSRDLIEAIRTLTVPPTVTIEVIRASAPDTVEAGPFEMTLRQVDYDAMTISGVIGADDLLNDTFPAGQFTPAQFPGLF